MAGTESAASLLRRLRQEQGRSLRTAAADIGIAPSQLSRLERGERKLGGNMSSRIASYYGVPPEAISLVRGDIPPDIIEIIRNNPELISRLRNEYSDKNA